MTALRRGAAALLIACGCAAPRPPVASSSPAGARHDDSAAPCGRYGDEAALQRSALEARAWAALVARPRSDGTDLEPSGALDRAARALAAAASRGEEGLLARSRVQAALRAAGAFDPAPTAHLVSGPPDEALAALLARADSSESTHAGLGEANADGTHHLVLLLSRRRAGLAPFPGAVAPGAKALLEGELDHLLGPRAWITRPDGATEEIRLGHGRGAAAKVASSFSTSVAFDTLGLHTIEILGSRDRGPEVAALITVSVGGSPCLPEAAGAPGGEGEERGASARIVDLVNRLRSSLGLVALTPSPDLATAAARQSERMLAAGKVAHVLAGGAELAPRLASEGIPFRRAFENVASGHTATDAHAAIEASPAHRANLLAPAASRIGVGLARGTLSTGEPVVYLTEILIEPPADPAADRLTPDARVREALWRERSRRALPPLTNDSTLEAIAREAAVAMRARDAGAIDGVTEAALAAGRKLAAADAFIARAPEEALRSRNLTDPRFRRVGVGVAAGDSRRYGPARLFISVVYGD